MPLAAASALSELRGDVPDVTSRRLEQRYLFFFGPLFFERFFVPFLADLTFLLEVDSPLLRPLVAEVVELLDLADFFLER